MIEANGLADARMRITLTSGAGPPGLARGDGPPTVLVAAHAARAVAADRDARSSRGCAATSTARSRA